MCSKATQVRRGINNAAVRPTTFACFRESTIFCGRNANAVRRMLKKPTEHAQSVKVSPLRDKLDPFAEPGADLVREIASTAAEEQAP